MGNRIYMLALVHVWGQNKNEKESEGFPLMKLFVKYIGVI